ncbi:pectin acetylesterase 10-like [Hordeum vulgare subsp. vulgare]|uniref:pectin acetylesterase 10-like n=1 Tax=Hordeum vulgare subsp. vulgare TaxID=112509 RepID=UPI001D1A5496|nr:pectin acetylesterase 10-like [Hordeum vulgare subsp. vulgare]
MGGGCAGYTPPPPVLASANPPQVQSSAKPPSLSVPAFTEVPLSVPTSAGPNLHRRILRRPSHDASAATFFPTPSRDASTPSATSYPSYDHRFPTLMDITLVVGSREKGAACVDGTPPGYHWLPGFWDGSDKWLLHLEGGSWCRNLTWCTQRKETNLGSSDHMETRAEFVGILSNDALQNPDFYNWNKVKVRYCDGAHVY